MGAIMKKSESMSENAFSQFKLTTNIITKLNTFKLTPTAKLVLLYLTTCYNPKHKEVFPKQKTISIKLGISERSVTRAIQELFKEGLVLIECKYTNRYKFTSRIVQEPPHLPPENLSDDKGQNDTKEDDNLSPHDIEPTIKHDKEQHTDDDYKILKDYAQKNYTSTPEKYLNWILKHKDVQKKILSDYKAKANAKKRALRAYEESQSLIKKYENMKKDCILPSESKAWQEFGKKINRLRNTAGCL